MEIFYSNDEFIAYLLKLVKKKPTAVFLSSFNIATFKFNQPGSYHVLEEMELLLKSVKELVILLEIINGNIKIILKLSDMICIYHSADLDGFMSAAIVKLKYPDCLFVGYNYYEPIPDEVWNSGDIIMVDVSFPPDTMLELQKSGNGFIWIDHHKNTIDKVELYFAENLTSMPFGIRHGKKAACELTWEYLFPDAPMPEIVRALGRYDCWGHVGTCEEEAIFQFQYGARSIIHNMDDAYDFLGNSLVDDKTENELLYNISITGKHIYSYLCEDAKWAYQRARIVELCILDESKDVPRVLNFAFIHKPGLNPKAMKLNYKADGYDGAASFSIHVDASVKVTLYSDDVDCAAIANIFGGGGHAGAAGFQIPLSEFQALYYNKYPWNTKIKSIKS